MNESITACLNETLHYNSLLNADKMDCGQPFLHPVGQVCNLNLKFWTVGHTFKDFFYRGMHSVSRGNTRFAWNPELIMLIRCTSCKSLLGSKPAKHWLVYANQRQDATSRKEGAILCKCPGWDYGYFQMQFDQFDSDLMKVEMKLLDHLWWRGFVGFEFRTY